MKKIILFLKVLFMLTGITLLVSCSGNNSNSNDVGNPPPTSAITIDNAGTVPILGKSQTTSVIYVHNNSNTPISGITYSYSLNTGDTQNPSPTAKSSKKSKQTISITSSNSFLNPSSTAMCATIQPFQSCPLTFTTPVLTDHALQGSATITLNYTANGKQFNFNQIVNFQEVSSVNPGVNINSGVNISGFGYTTGYGTVYMYAGGTNQIYTVTSLTSSNAVSISNGNISGQEIASNYVQAVELSAPILQNGIASTLKVISTDSTQPTFYTSLASVGVYPINNGGILVAGQVPVINTSQSSNPGGSVTILNAGNAAVTLGSSGASTGISNLSGCTSGSSLGVGESCTITFNVNQSSGSGTITLNYTGGSSATSVSQAITWYNSTGGALLALTYTNPISFVQTQSVTENVTVTNVGGFNLTNVSATTPQTLFGSATATVSYPAGNSNCATTLNIESSCQYTLTITDPAVNTSGQILIGATGSYTNGSSQTYTRNAILNYSTVANAPNLAITPNPAESMTIQGNNSESTTQTLLITNAGNANATISSQGITATYASYFTTTNDCGGSVASGGGSCTVTVKLNPYTASQQITGTAVYQVTYSGGSSSTLTATDNIPFTITPNQQGISIVSVTPSGYSSGSGTSASPYIFPGNNTSQSITLVIQNTGSNPIKFSGGQDTNSALTWSSDSSASCYGHNSISGSSLQPGSTCQIIYNNMLGENSIALGAVGSSYTENLIVPTLIFQDQQAVGTQFQEQPNLPSGGTTVYANANLATIANSVTTSNAGTANATVTVQSVLTNGSNYASIPVAAEMENYFESATVNTPGSCNTTPNLESSMATQNCTLSAGNNTASITYLVESGITQTQTTPLHTAFSMNNSNQVVGFSPTYITTNLQEQ